MNPCLCTSAYSEGRYILPELPYAPESMATLLDAETIRLHHDFHHASYVKGANEAAAALRTIARGEAPLSGAAEATRLLTFNLSGHVLHTLYWNSITPELHSQPRGILARAIDSSFGSPEAFLRVFRSVTLAVQGSGWGVLGVDSLSKQLMVCAVHCHQDALVGGFYPLMVCDVWEHAYYLRYHNDRAAYVDTFLSHINWEFVSHRYNNYGCHE